MKILEEVNKSEGLGAISLTGFATRLFTARLKAGYPSARAAAAIQGWPSSLYVAHEAGTRVPSPQDCWQYAKAFALAVNPSWLLQGIGAPPRPS